MEGTRTRRRPSSISRARQHPGRTSNSRTGRQLDSVSAFMSCKCNKTAGILPESSSCLLFLCRSALEGTLSSSYRPQDTLSAERERRRLEREERLQRIEREERNRFRLASLHSFHARDSILDSLSFKAEAAVLPKSVVRLAPHLKSEMCNYQLHLSLFIVITPALETCTQPTSPLLK